MRAAFALLAILAVPAFAETPAPVTRVEVFASHESDGIGHEERLIAVEGKGGPELRLQITNGCEVDEMAPVAIPREAWVGLLEVVSGYSLQTWDLPPGVAPDWGTQGYEVEAKAVVSRSWTGPFNGWAPPLALHRRMAELAQSLCPGLPLQYFKSDRGPASRRIRTWSLAGGLVFPPKHGGPLMDMEAEAWDDRRVLTVRSNETGFMLESVTELTVEKWDRLWALAAAPALAKWDGKEGMWQTVDHGGGGLAVTGPDVKVRHNWAPPDLPGDEGPVGGLLKALADAGTKDPVGLELVGPEGRVSAVVIDFAIVTPQRTLIYCKFGSTTLVFIDVSKEVVELRVGGEVEMGAKKTVVYRVPRTEGKKRFENGGTGVDLSSIEAYRQK